MSDVTLLRMGILVAGLLLLAAIWFFGRPGKPGQGRRLQSGGRDGRVEPSLGAQLEDELASDPSAPGEATLQSELDLFERTLDGGAAAGASELGKRANEDFDKIVSLYLAARAGEQLHGPDIVVAAEKAGLVYGYMNVFHRLVEGHPERGPVFSVANIVKPGSFDMAGDPGAGDAGDRVLPDPAGAAAGARRLGDDAAHRAAHGRAAGRGGARRRPQRAGPPAHRPHPRRAARLRSPARGAAADPPRALVTGGNRKGSCPGRQALAL
jgi:hypothetical protein